MEKQTSESIREKMPKRGYKPMEFRHIDTKRRKVRK